MKPPNFPITFKEFLRRAIGGRLYADRLHIFRKYWCSELAGYAALGSRPPYGDDNQTEEGRLKMANDIIAKHQREGVDDWFFNLHFHPISKWRKENQIRQRKEAAKSRWQKEKKKKPLAPAKKQEE